MPSRVPPGSKETASGETSLTFFKARVAPQGLRAFCLPRWRNRDTRMSQKHDVPGSNPGWGTSFFTEAKVLPPLRQRPEQADRSFTTWDVASTGQAWLNGKSATLPASRREFEAHWLPH